MIPLWFVPVFFFLMLGLLIASQLFWFLRARHFLRRVRPVGLRWLLGVPIFACFGVLFGMLLLAPLRWLLADDAPVFLSLFLQLRRPEFMVPAGLWTFASLGSFVLILLVRSSAWLIARLRRVASEAIRGGSADPAPEVGAVERRYFLETVAYAAGALPFVMTGYGFLRGRRSYTVQEVTIPIENLPPALGGLRLVQLTDIHASAYMPVSEIRRIVGLARELDADLVVHTGDFLTSPGDPLEEAIAELAQLEGRFGSFGCLGNHEIYAQASEAATELFARHGVRILRRENAEVSIRGARLNLIGVDYQLHPHGPGPERSKSFFLRGVEKLVRADALNLLLSHNPNPFLRAAELGIELILAGHTHGGQVQVEILETRWSPARFMTPFVSGLYRQGNSQLYVSRGLGTVGAPVRLNAPPEITVLTLAGMARSRHVADGLGSMR